MDNIKRGCGKRVAGGAYIVTELSNKGIPLDAFLFDPPVIPMDDEGNPHYPGAVGLHLMNDVENPSVAHIWDWIGTNYYPTFPDFWEETHKFGLSRRISVNTNFDKLVFGESQIIGFHALGILKGTKKFYHNLDKEFVLGTRYNRCPHNVLHDKDNPFCVRYLWQLVDMQKGDEERLHAVPMPRNDGSTGTYQAVSTPSWVKRFKTEWVPAAMFHLPIHRIEVVADPIGGTHEQAIEAIEKSITNLPLIIVTE
jgi:hypothetical protein